jgi:NifB/MoaA-like Fe-S oxidoreductase
MLDEFEYIYEDAARAWKRSGVKSRKVTLATGSAAYSFLSAMALDLCSVCRGLEIDVVEIKNNFFGESITVAGLLTGKDIYEQLLGKELGDELLIPASALREQEEDFLCGMTVDELSDRLSVPILASDGDGISLAEAMLGMEIEIEAVD